MVVREATADDWSAIWRIMQPIIEAGETYALARDLSEGDARRFWLPEDARVAVGEIDGRVVGSSKCYPNRAGSGAHVAGGSFIVDQGRPGEGIGRGLGREMIEWAGAAGYKLIEFTAVVETNERAVGLWKSLGFEIAGTVPRAFEHPSQGLVGVHVMYLEL